MFLTLLIYLASDVHVPQGSMLGLLLILDYMNDVTDHMSSSCHLFADDCILYKKINSPTDITSYRIT